MKFIRFKRYKFSTIFKDIDFRRYNFSKFYKYIDFRRYNFSRLYKYSDFIRYNFLKFYRYIDFRRYNFLKFYRYIDFRRYNFLKFYRYIDLKKYKHIYFYSIGIIFITIIIYLNIPMFYNYDKSKIENVICGQYNIECSIQGKIKYSFFPSPRLKFSNIIVKDFNNKQNILGNIQNVEIKISFYNLHKNENFKYKKIEIKKAEINFDYNNLKEYKNIFKKKFYTYPINLQEGEINFFDNKKKIATIKNASLKYKIIRKNYEIILNGNFLGDTININLQNNKNEKKPSIIFVLKLLNSKLFTKLNIYPANLEKNIIKGDVLFKKGKNRLTVTFDYKDNQVIIKNGNLRNPFLYGQLNGLVKLLPYFDFDINVDLNDINFNKFSNLLINLDKETKKNLFRINKKINGQLNLSTNKIYSKYNFINSFESRIKFINGNILIEQLLLSLGKLGAADISGMISNEKKFTNFKFENNIYIDNLKKIYNKFGIFNKQKIPGNLFVSGNLDLVNLKMRFDEMSNDQKFKNEDVVYIEKEFNDIILKEGYETFCNFLNIKEFFKVVTLETN